YGDGKSEENLGRVLAELSETPGISTKFKLRVEDGDIPGQIERALEQSLKRLGMERVDLFQLHNNILLQASGNGLTPAQILGPGGVIESLERMRDQGLTKWLGVTAIGDARACRQVIASGRVDTAQVYYNLINPSSDFPAEMADGPIAGGGHNFSGVLRACADNDVGVIAIRTLAAGALAGDSYAGRGVITRDSEPDDERAKAGAVFDLLGDRYGTRAQTALSFALAHPAIACIDFAVAEPWQMIEGLKSVDLGPLPDDARAAVLALYQDNFGGT
ncbi:MAG: aldo/keto reductase, partial [Alphaproteobacteria bacterium]|nr:aldo/keto reductase [Alphaproteobacteria bacterium]